MPFVAFAARHAAAVTIPPADAISAEKMVSGCFFRFAERENTEMMLDLPLQALDRVSHGLYDTNSLVAQHHVLSLIVLVGAAEARVRDPNQDLATRGCRLWRNLMAYDVAGLRAFVNGYSWHD